MPSVRPKSTAASNAARCLIAVASISPSSSSMLTNGAAPWYRNPPAWMPAGTKVCPRVCIFTSGVS
jgi:hypothetical protein